MLGFLFRVTRGKTVFRTPISAPQSQYHSEIAVTDSCKLWSSCCEVTSLNVTQSSANDGLRARHWGDFLRFHLYRPRVTVVLVRLPCGTSEVTWCTTHEHCVMSTNCCLCRRYASIHDIIF